MTEEEKAAAAKAAAEAQQAQQRALEDARKATEQAQAAAKLAQEQADAAKRQREDLEANAKKQPKPDADQEDEDLKGLPKSVREELVEARRLRREAEQAKAEAEARAEAERKAFATKLAELETGQKATQARLEQERLERELVETAPHVQAPEVRRMLLGAYREAVPDGKTSLGEWLASEGATKHPIYGVFLTPPKVESDTVVRNAPPISRGARPGGPPAKTRVSETAKQAAVTPAGFDAIANDWRADLSERYGRPVGSGGKRARGKST